jgi:8-amino-7-oxononanoate synthase
MLLDRLHQRFREREAAGLVRTRYTSLGPSTRTLVRTALGAEASGLQLLSFASNDYLGLTDHPEVVNSFHEGLDRYGAGSGASAMVSGHSEAHEALERACVAWMRPQFPELDCLLFSTGYMANLAVLTALTERGDALFCDKLNHASLVDGMRLSEADHRRFPHSDLDVLEDQLRASKARVKLIVTDGVFSMDGDIAPLGALAELAERYDATLFVDDAHGVGVLGAEGRGSLAWAGVRSERVILMGTLGKAGGVSGAFVAAHPLIIGWLQQAARSYVYSTAPPPAASHALVRSIALIRGQEGDRRRAHLQSLIRVIAARSPEFEARGIRHLASDTAIQPLILGSNDAAVALSQWLTEDGFWVPAIRPPTVPAGTARLRVSLSAEHRAADLERLCSRTLQFPAEASPKD